MQEASGADFTDLNWSAQLPSADLDTDHRLHSSPGPLLTFPIQARCSRSRSGRSFAAGVCLRQAATALHCAC